MKAIMMLTAVAALGACTVNAPDADQPGNSESAETAEAENGGDTTQARRDLEAANAAYDQALIAGDAAALAQIYTDDFQIVDDDGAVHNKQDQIDFMTKKVDLLEAQGSDVQVTMLGPDAAMVTGRFTGRYRMDGAERDFVERYSSVWVRQGDRWRVRHEHASMVPPSSEAAGT